MLVLDHVIVFGRVVNFDTSAIQTITMPSATLGTGMKRNSIDRAESDVNIQKANSLSDSFEKASLHILQAPTLFQHKVTEFHDHDPSAPKFPADISNDVAAQVVSALWYLAAFTNVLSLSSRFSGN